MSHKQAEQSTREKLVELLGQLNNFSLESLVRPELGKDFDFKDASYILERILNLFKELQEANLDAMLIYDLSELANRCGEGIQLFGKIQTFSPKDLPNPTNVRNTFRDISSSNPLFLIPNFQAYLIDSAFRNCYSFSALIRRESNGN